LRQRDLANQIRIRPAAVSLPFYFALLLEHESFWRLPMCAVCSSANTFPPAREKERRRRKKGDDAEQNNNK
jgi:hypothetical protein